MNLQRLASRIRVTTLLLPLALTLLIVQPTAARTGAARSPSSGRSSTAPAARGDWAQFRFGPSHRGWNPFETVLSPSTVSGLEEQWSKPTGQAIMSSPAVANGIAYAGTVDVDGKLHAQDATGGETLWVGPPPLTGGMDASPAVARGVVYEATLYGAVYAMDAVTGDLLWTAGDPFGVIVSSPTLARGVVYVGSTSALMALDADDGRTLWTSEMTPGYTSPAVAGRRLYVAANGSVHALDAVTGAELWTTPTGSIFWSSPAVADGMVYVGSNDHKVYALDAATGEIVWTKATGDWVQSSPAVANGVVYIGSNDRRLYALDAATGARRWIAPLGDIVFSSPAVANGVVYVGTSGGRLFALRASDGMRLWSAPVGDEILSSPAVSHGMVYAGTYDDAGKIVAFGLGQP